MFSGSKQPIKIGSRIPAGTSAKCQKQHFFQIKVNDTTSSDHFINTSLVSYHDDRNISVAVVAALLLGVLCRGYHQSCRATTTVWVGGGPDDVLALVAVGEDETILVVRVVRIEKSSTAGTAVSQRTSPAHHDPQCAISRGDARTPWW